MYIGKIFVCSYPPEIADWCNLNNAHLEELEKVGDLRQFKIVENQPEPVEIQIKRLESYLEKTNSLVIEAFEAQTSVPEDLRIERAEAREKIRLLREREGDKNNDNSNIIRTDNKN